MRISKAKKWIKLNGIVLALSVSAIVSKHSLANFPSIKSNFIPSDEVKETSSAKTSVLIKVKTKTKGDSKEFLLEDKKLKFGITETVTLFETDEQKVVMKLVPLTLEKNPTQTAMQYQIAVHDLSHGINQLKSQSRDLTFTRFDRDEVNFQIDQKEDIGKILEGEMRRDRILDFTIQLIE